MKPTMNLRRLFRGQDGASLAELALLTPMLFLILLGGIDFSRAYFLAMEVSGAAQAGATYGVLHRTDTTGMSSAATMSAPDVPNLAVSTPTWGCECSDGTQSSTSCGTAPSCSTNVVYWVKVSTSTTYRPVFPWPGIPSSVAIAETARMRTQN